MITLFTLTIFLGAFLVFLVQPLVARLVLPSLGGSPEVWNTCMLFFQSLLLAGYGYAHVVTTRLRVGRQATVHLAILLLPLVVLPIGAPTWFPTPNPHAPIPWLLGMLLVVVGLPFFAVSTAGPLLQRWFAHTGHRHASDPYFLYAASNVGSLLALLGYPVLFEPRLTQTGQTRLWALLYLAFVLLCWVCAVTAARRARTAGPDQPPTALEMPPAPPGEALASREVQAKRSPPTWRTRARWTLLAFAPSSLMLGATHHMSTDVAAIPLMWILPLSTYLLTFILAFARRSLISPRVASSLLVVLAGVVTGMTIADLRRPIPLVFGAHLALLFAAGLVCHGRLARERPETRYLTEFYLILAVGGALGGVFNSLIAPMAFNWIAEYPIAIVVACWLRERRRPETVKSVVTSFASLSALMLLVVAVASFMRWYRGDASWTMPGWLESSVPSVIPVVAAVLLAARPWRYALAIAILLGASHVEDTRDDHVLWHDRTFFGVLSVKQEDGRLGPERTLVHGTTLHGSQVLAAEFRDTPTTYYHPLGPVGDVMSRRRADHATAHVGVVGLGAGTMAAHARPGESWTFFEIDPSVRSIATNPEFFTFVSDAIAAGTSIDIILGDGRLSLEAQPPETFDLIVLDAFSSDAIPVHLLTREAVALYVERLAPGGVLAVHISNRYLDLAPILAAIAEDLGLSGRIRTDHPGDDEPRDQVRRFASEWVALSASEASILNMPHAESWKPMPAHRPAHLWTDDYSNLLSVLDVGWN
ncbi:MAG: fused MFS/spermidine synthase [Phycisphaeraceae bacterium]|nr:fused MFS/spermidine synthase [Phycisphaeraceae bacterium]